VKFENPVCREAGGVFCGSLLLLAMVCGCWQWFIRRAGGLAAKGRKKGAEMTDFGGGGVRECSVYGRDFLTADVTLMKNQNDGLLE
jgi:hypothetical protein